MAGTLLEHCAGQCKVRLGAAAVRTAFYLDAVRLPRELQKTTTGNESTGTRLGTVSGKVSYLAAS